MKSGSSGTGNQGFVSTRCSLWWIYTGYAKSLVNSLVSLLEREILIWLLLTETFESLWMGSLQLTTPHRKWLNSE